MAWPPSEDVFRRQAKQDLTDRLVVQDPSLALLRDRVDVAQPPLERIFLEYRHRAAVVIQRVDDLPRRLNGPGGGEAEAGALIGFHFAAFLDGFQRLVRPRMQETDTT